MIRIDLENGWISEEVGGQEVRHSLGSSQGFDLASRAWLRAGWDAKYVYSFTWMGRPVIQLPDDMLRMQEAIWRIKPSLVIETGVAHGGSLIFYASLLKAMGKGRVIGIDVEIRPHNRAAIDAHFLREYIQLIEGSSTAPEVVSEVRKTLPSIKNEPVLVILDSNHSRDHVRAELEAYSGLVTPGSYIVATDGIMKDLVGAPRSSEDWNWNNPHQAAKEFVAAHGDFEICDPQFDFNEGTVTNFVTYWPGAWIRRKK